MAFVLHRAVPACQSPTSLHCLVCPSSAHIVLAVKRRKFSSRKLSCWLCQNNFVYLQNVRGGTVKLAHITAPQSDFGGPEGKGDALHAMELALSFEKLNFQKLKELHSIADKNDDAQMADFVEDMLEEQVCT